MKWDKSPEPLPWLKPTFYTLGLVGTCLTWGLSAMNGTLPWLLQKTVDYEFILPGTQSLARTSFTGIWPIDILLRLLVIFYYEAVDGSHPTLSILSFYFLTQHYAFVTAMYTDSLRKGSTVSFFETTLWLLVFQFTAVGCSGWMFALATLSAFRTSSAPNATSRLRDLYTLEDPRSLCVLPLALILGFWIPSLLMSLSSPSVVSNSFQQVSIAVWNVFPIFVYMSFRVLSFGMRLFAPWDSNSHMVAIGTSNLIASWVAMGSHIAISTLSLAPILFPSLFDQDKAQALSPTSIAKRLYQGRRSDTIGDGVGSFLLWDQIFGYAVMLLLALVKLQGVMLTSNRRRFRWATSLLSTLVLCIVVGPGTTCLVLNWSKDWLLFGSGRSGNSIDSTPTTPTSPYMINGPRTPTSPSSPSMIKGPKGPKAPLSIHT